MSDTTSTTEQPHEQALAEASAVEKRIAALDKHTAALNKNEGALISHAKAVETFQVKWKDLDVQAKAQLRECWDLDHRKAERSQSFCHCFGIGVLVLAWLALLVGAIFCLEAPLSDMGKYGAIVICVFLIASISVPASVVFYVMKRQSE